MPEPATATTVAERLWKDFGSGQGSFDDLPDKEAWVDCANQLAQALMLEIGMEREKALDEIWTTILGMTEK